MILNASAENGSVSSALRLSSFSSSSMPLTGGRSIGDGSNWMTASSIACTPLFLNAVPQNTGIDFDAQRALAHAGDDLGLGQVALVEVLVHQLFGRLGGGLDHEAARFGALVGEVGRDVAVFELRALRRDVPVDRLHLDQVDHAFEVVFGADRHLHRHRVGAEARLQLLDDLEEVGAGAVHLVDERQARHGVLVGLAPHGLGLRLHAADGAQHEHRAVEHAQRTLDFDGEVDVPGGVDDVEAVLRQSTCPCPTRSRSWRRT